MKKDCFKINDVLIPSLLAIDENFLVAYKPPRMHTAPQAMSCGGTMLEYCFKEFPEIMNLPGRRAGEAGLLHRLDYETHGLLLVARTLQGMEMLLRLQSEGKINKEYSALAIKNNTALQGFPSSNHVFSDIFLPSGNINTDTESPDFNTPLCNNNSFFIKSGFRPYGKGRKAVRPVSALGGEAAIQEKKRRSRKIAQDRGGPYITEIMEARLHRSEIAVFRLRICRGFRHQIRSHLAWMRMPIVNDTLYGGTPCGNGMLGLRACSIDFFDPISGKERRYSIPELTPEIIQFHS